MHHAVAVVIDGSCRGGPAYSAPGLPWWLEISGNRVVIVDHHGVALGKGGKADHLSNMAPVNLVLIHFPTHLDGKESFRSSRYIARRANRGPC